MLEEVYIGTIFLYSLSGKQDSHSCKMFSSALRFDQDFHKSEELARNVGKGLSTRKFIVPLIILVKY